MALNFEYKYYPADVYVISMGENSVSMNSSYDYTGDVEIPIGKTYLTLVNYNGNLRLTGDYLRKVPYSDSGYNASYGSNPMTETSVLKNYRYTSFTSQSPDISNLNLPDLDDDYGTIYSGSIHRPIYNMLYNTALAKMTSDELVKIALCDLVNQYSEFNNLSQEDFDQYDFTKLASAFRNTTVRGLGTQYTTDSDYCLIDKSKLNSLASDYPDMFAYLCEARFILDEDTTYKYRFVLYRKTVNGRTPSSWSDATYFVTTESGSSSSDTTQNQYLIGRNASYASSNMPIVSSLTNYKYYFRGYDSMLRQKDMIYLRASNGVFPIMVNQRIQLYSYNYSSSNYFYIRPEINISLPYRETGAIRLIIDDFYGLGTSLPSGGGGTPIPDPSPPDPTPEPEPGPGPEPPTPTPAVNPYEPAGGVDTTDTGPTEGTFTPIHDDVDWTPHIDNLESLGLTRWYACDQTQIDLLGQRLLSTNVLMEIAKYFVDFKSLIISLTSVPFLIDPVFNCEEESDIGFAFLGLADQVVMTRGRKIKDGTQLCPFGRVTVPRFYGNFIDYKYTTYEIYLPYFGVTALDPELVAGHEIDLTYVVDLLTGDASIQIQNIDNNDIISILNTHLNESITLSETSNNSVQLIEALLSTATPIAGAGAALAGGMLAMTSKAPTQPRWEMALQPDQAVEPDFPDSTQYQGGQGKVNLEKDPYNKQTNVNDVYSNYQNAANDALNSLINYRPHLAGDSFSSMSSITGKLNPQKAYLMIRRPELVQSSNQSMMGYPCYIGGEISEFIGTGYTEFRDIRFEGEFLYSSQEELSLIKTVLRNGVIL